jgi:cell division protein FtsW
VTTRAPAASAAQAAPVRHAPDYALLSVVAMLLVLGLIAVYSASYALGYAQFGDANYFIKRQAVFALLGVIAMVITMNFDYHHLRALSPLLMLLALAGLAAVLVPGIGAEANGARRWIALGSLPQLQPSEFAKLAVLIYMSAWLAAKGVAVKDFSLGVFPFVSMVGIVGALIMLEPDLGTAVMVAAITGTLFFVAGARIKHVLALGASGVVMLAVLVLSGGYRMDRILSFTSPNSDPSGVGFHTLQLLIAFGSGGISGLGLGVSRQKFFYVPGSHTDGVLAIVGEELGLIGVVVVLGLFAVLLWRGWRIAQRAGDPFGSLLAVGVLAWIGFQMLINVGGVTHTFPLTGIPLPLLSYGGSALASTLTAIGLLLSVSRYAAIEKEARVAPVRGAVRVPARAAAPSAPGRAALPARASTHQIAGPTGSGGTTRGSR